MTECPMLAKVMAAVCAPHAHTVLRPRPSGQAPPSPSQPHKTTGQHTACVTCSLLAAVGDRGPQKWHYIEEGWRKSV